MCVLMFCEIRYAARSSLYDPGQKLSRIGNFFLQPEDAADQCPLPMPRTDTIQFPDYFPAHAKARARDNKVTMIKPEDELFKYVEKYFLKTKIRITLALGGKTFLERMATS